MHNLYRMVRHNNSVTEYHRVKLKAKKRQEVFQGLNGIRHQVQTLLIINNCPEIVYFKTDCKVIYETMTRVLVKLH